jgi:hypothetical protein
MVKEVGLAEDDESWVMSLRKIDMMDVGTAFILLDITFSHLKTFTVHVQPEQ